jgi:hypothetical protein
VLKFKQALEGEKFAEGEIKNKLRPAYALPEKQFLSLNEPLEIFALFRTSICEMSIGAPTANMPSAH